MPPKNSLHFLRLLFQEGRQESGQEFILTFISFITTGIWGRKCKLNAWSLSCLGIGGKVLVLCWVLICMEGQYYFGSMTDQSSAPQIPEVDRPRILRHLRARLLRLIREPEHISPKALAKRLRLFRFVREKLAILGDFKKEDSSFETFLNCCAMNVIPPPSAFSLPLQRQWQGQWKEKARRRMRERRMQRGRMVPSSRGQLGDQGQPVQPMTGLPLTDHVTLFF
jgi:hypothetical protein